MALIKTWDMCHICICDTFTRIRSFCLITMCSFRLNSRQTILRDLCCFFWKSGFFSRNRNHRLYWPKVRQQFRGQAFHINHVVEDACSQHFSQVPVHKCIYILGLLISILTHLTSIYCSTALLWFQYARPCPFFQILSWFYPDFILILS